MRLRPLRVPVTVQLRAEDYNLKNTPGEPITVKTWNVAAILALTGGAQGLKQLLGRHGQAVPDASAIAMWKARGRLPGNWSAQVIYALGESQTPVDLKLLITDARANADDDLFAA